MWKNEIELQKLFEYRAKWGKGSPETNERHEQDRKKSRSYEGFPYVVLTRADYYFLDEVDKWCEEKFGLKHGECDKLLCTNSDHDYRDMNECFINFIHQIIHHNKIVIPYYCSISFDSIKKLCKTEEQYNNLKIKSNSKFTIEISKDKIECDILILVDLIKALTENEIDDLIDRECDFTELCPYEHSHKGVWQTNWITKCGYDEGFQDYAFKNSYDAMLFKLTWGDRL
jgi:hypothetical protein